MEEGLPVYRTPRPITKPLRESPNGRKRVAVVGGGLAGICAARNLLAVGIEPVIFDRNPKLGGLWNFNPDPNCGYMYQSCCVNSNKQSMQFPDHQFPEHEPDYPRHPGIISYLDTYAERFNLYDYVAPRTNVLDASEHAPGAWTITFESLDGAFEKDFVKVDGLVIANGQTTAPFIPEYPGMANFKGEIMHACNFRTAGKFHGKKVLIVGLGTATGSDLAQEISFAASHTSVSVRRGQTFLPRYLLGLNRWDWFGGRTWWLHFGIEQRINQCYMYLLDTVYYLMYGDLGELGIRKFNRKLDSKQSTSPICTDACAFPQRVKLGYIKMRKAIKQYHENGVEFVNGEFQEVDHVVYCTGYHREVAFTINGKNFEFPDTPLFHYTFNPEYRNVAFSVFFKPTGPSFTQAWLQGRWLAQVFAGELKLPSAEFMLKNSKAQSRHHGVGGLDPFNLHDEFMEQLELARPTNMQLMGMMFYKPFWVYNYLMKPRWNLWIPISKLCPKIEKYPGSSQQKIGDLIAQPIGSSAPASKVAAAAA